ncbi:MAG: DUF4129 domain-containing protein [Nocardioidaceae bacterium]
MTGKQRRLALELEALLPTAVVLGLVVLAWAAATGPVRLMSPSGRTRSFEPSATPSASPTSDEPTTGSLREVTRNVQPTFHLAWLGDLLIYTLLIGLGIAAFLAARYLWRNRWRPPERPAAVEFDVLPDVAVREALREDVDAQLAAIGAGSVRNAIVACWVRLENIVAAAGYPRSPAETSSEFVVRILRGLDLDPRAAGALAALYREARFSEHDLGEDVRTAAREALQALHDDLRARGAVS